MRRTERFTRWTPARVVALATLAALAATGAGACISEHRASTGPDGSVADGECRIPVGSPVIGGTQALVAIRGFAFQPETVRVRRGTTVTWVNCEPPSVDAHTSTSDVEAWQSPFLAPGATYSHTFETAGAFGYFCVPHPFMRGAVVVE